MELNFDKEFYSKINPVMEYSDTKPLLNLQWDGTDVGNIDSCVMSITKTEYEEDEYILGLWSLNSKNQRVITRAKLLKYRDEVPLIADECKPLFGIKKVGKHKATLCGYEVILVRYQGDISLKKYLQDRNLKPEKTGVYFIEEMRKIFAFRWIMCLNNNFENTIEVRTEGTTCHPISCKENTFSYHATENATRIPKTIIKNWFEDNDDLSEKYIIDMLKDKDISMIRIQIQKIIMKFNKQLIGWNNSIFDKMLHSKKD